ncbi:hypothetical protein N7494_000724 [Penicillium frequentans]|uniref:Uncharacterized protein n=1 Tax=Penicillium frequentans TaxID=3151616 RepID=A0AAD6D6C2_9EURO|nr:hypothetical protein N7494_000724 [Penicillium glabrum]
MGVAQLAYTKRKLTAQSYFLDTTGDDRDVRLIPWYEGSVTELSLGVRNPERDASDALDGSDFRSLTHTEFTCCTKMRL